MKEKKTKNKNKNLNKQKNSQDSQVTDYIREIIDWVN